MIVSGLWKLAAMASVVGVGLFAVFQAQHGLDKPLTPVSNSSADDESDDLGVAADPAEKDPAKAPADKLAGNPSPDPFDLITAQADSPSPRPLPIADENPATDERQTPTPAESLPAEFGQTPSDGPSLNSKSSAGPGLDFRDQTSGSFENVGVRPKPRPVQPASFEEEPPARLPGEEPSSSPAVVEESPRRNLSPRPEPFVRQSKSNADPFDVSDHPPAGSPFDPSSSQDSLATPSSNGLTADDVAGSPDPFATDPPSVQRPAKAGAIPPAALQQRNANASEPDPFATSSPEEVPDTNSPPALSFPATKRAESARREIVPDETPSSPFSTSEERGSFSESPTSPSLGEPARLEDFGNRRSLPRLPTDVREPGLSLEDAGSPPLTSGPSGRRPETESRPATRTNDLIGDGTIATDTPRGVQQPRLTIEKIAPQQAVLGEPLVYSVIVRNVGGDAAHQVVVEDRIPKGTELTGTAPRAEMVDKKLIWRIGTLKPNEERKISIRVIPRQEGSIGSVARVSFAAEVAAEIVIAAPQLSFTVNAPRQVRIGESFEMTFVLKNTGNAPATSVSVRDLVPEGLKHEAAADIECPIGKLAPNESREIVLQVTAVKPGLVKNRAILSGDGGIAQELESPIEIVGEQLVLTRSGHDRIYIDRPTVFTNNVRNEGNAEVKQVRVAEIVPAGMEFVDASGGGRFDPIERTVFWNVGPLPPGSEAAVKATLVAKSPGLQHGKITASGPAGSAATLKSEVDAVGRPELQIETVGRTGVVAVGDRLTSKIELRNHGSESARNVGLSIRLPRELKLIEVRGGKYTIRDNVVVFDPIATVNPKAAASFELVMEADAEADAQMSLEISADHLSKPARRNETIQIATEVR